MRTEILPGFSPRNKEWAEAVKKELAPLDTEMTYWSHWESGEKQPGWIEMEAEKIIARGQKVNILAKSVGTAVAMVILGQKPELVNKLVLCGIPLADFEEGDERYYDPLKSFPAERVLCIQNENDNHGSYASVQAFVHSLNPAINIIPKPRNDHEYPYPKDFIRFLTK